MIVVTILSLLLLTKTNYKLDKSINLVIFGFLILLGVKLLQSYTDGIDEKADSLQDAIILMIFEGCWAVIYFFVSEMQIVNILLLSFENLGDYSESNILKTNQSKGERIRNLLKTRRLMLILLGSSAVCQLALKIISTAINSELFGIESMVVALNFFLGAYIIYLFNQQCFAFAETRHASGLKPHSIFPGILLLNIIVGLVFSRHLLHTILSVMRAFPSALALFRIRTMIVI